MDPYKLRNVLIHGHDIRYRRAGSGEAVVLIHGLAGNSLTWRSVLPGLAATHDMIAPDLLGHGESAKPMGDYSLGAFASVCVATAAPVQPQRFHPEALADYLAAARTREMIVGMCEDYRAAATNGVNVDTLSAIGSANLALGRLGQAEKMLRDALEEDPTFVPAMNNLGVVLMERGQFGEARVVFQQAFAQDSGQTDSIRENLKLAIASSEASVLGFEEEKGEFRLVRRDKGKYVLLTQL
jgi:pimeloyl-ACP methyl ester carboxylesterase